MYKLDGRAALVTGAASGIGRAISVRLAREGCDVGVLDLNRAGAEETAALVTREGRSAKVIAADVSDYDQVSAAVADVIGTFGKLDLLYNNAGIVRVGSLAETSIEEWNAVFRINVNGVFHCCKAAVPHMIERRAGRIINTASWFGKIGKANYGAYCSSKFAVVGITQSLAAELAPHKINVNAVCPGTIIETGMRDEADRMSVAQGLPTAKQREASIPLGRVGYPDDIARVAVFLASDEASYMTGQAINVTGGLWMH